MNNQPPLILDLGPNGRRNLTDQERIAYSVWALSRIDVTTLPAEEVSIHFVTQKDCLEALQALPGADSLLNWAKMFGPQVETAERPLPGPGIYWRDRGAVQHMAEECQLKVVFCSWCASIMAMTPATFGHITDSICQGCAKTIS